MVDLPTVVCYGDSNTHGADGPTRAAVLLVAPPPLGALTIASELWGFGSGRETSTRLAPLYREVAAQSGAAFLDAGALVATDPSDGVHLDAAAHAVLGRAVAAAVAGLLPGSPATAPGALATTL